MKKLLLLGVLGVLSIFCISTGCSSEIYNFEYDTCNDLLKQNPASKPLFVEAMQDGKITDYEYFRIKQVIAKNELKNSLEITKNAEKDQ